MKTKMIFTVLCSSLSLALSISVSHADQSQIRDMQKRLKIMDGEDFSSGLEKYCDDHIETDTKIHPMRVYRTARRWSRAGVPCNDAGKTSVYTCDEETKQCTSDSRTIDILPDGNFVSTGPNDVIKFFRFYL